MKIRDILSVHTALVEISGGPGLNAKLGKFTYPVLKNLRKAEAEIKIYAEARDSMIIQTRAAYPDLENNPEAIKELEAQLEALLDSTVKEFVPHKISPDIMEICTVAQANQILPLIEDEEVK